MKVNLTMGGALIAILSSAVWTGTVKEYRAGEMRVIILPVGKEAGKEHYESRIEFRTVRGRFLCAVDYSSEDNEHGFGVVKAAWTPDEQFFVFSLTSSGGHQAWHAPIHSYSRKTGMISSLDDYQDGAGITDGDFQLVAPNIVETAILKDDAIPVKFRLDSLGKPVGWRQKPLRFKCAGGRVFKPER